MTLSEVFFEPFGGHQINEAPQDCNSASLPDAVVDSTYTLNVFMAPCFCAIALTCSQAL